MELLSTEEIVLLKSFTECFVDYPMFLERNVAIEVFLNAVSDTEKSIHFFSVGVEAIWVN